MRPDAFKKVSFLVILVLTIGLFSLSEAYAKEIVLRFASGYVPYPHKFSPEEVKGPEAFCALINKKGVGKVKVEFYPAGQLFKDKDMMTAIPEGGVDMGITTMSQWAGLIPAVTLYELPFFFNNEEHFQKVFYSKAGELIGKEFEKKNLKILGIWKNGPLVLLNKKKEIIAPDLSGFKLRVFGKVPAELITELSGAPVFMSASEIYLALQRGTVDGLITTPYGMVGYKLYEVTKYVTSFPNYWTTFPILINLKTWDSLPDDIKDIISKSAKEILDISKNEKWCVDHASEAFEIAVKQGMIKHDLTVAEYQDWKRKSVAVAEKFEKEVGDFGKKLVQYAIEAGK